MNKDRRKRLESIAEDLDNLFILVEEVRDEEQDVFDNMPENLLASERAENSESAIGVMEEILDGIENLKSLFDDVQQY